MNDATELRPFDDWTPNYVRKCIAAGLMTLEDAQAFRDAFRDGMTLEELTKEACGWCGTVRDKGPGVRSEKGTRFCSPECLAIRQREGENHEGRGLLEQE